MPRNLKRYCASVEQAIVNRIEYDSPRVAPSHDRKDSLASSKVSYRPMPPGMLRDRADSTASALSRRTHITVATESSVGSLLPGGFKIEPPPGVTPAEKLITGSGARHVSLKAQPQTLTPTPPLKPPAPRVCSDRGL